MNLPEPQRVETRIDTYVDAYSARMAGVQQSAVRALFAVANRPEIVSLAGGMPNITDLPLDKIAAAMQDLILTKGPQAMQYGSGQGELMIRQDITEVMKLEGINAHADDVVITAGSQQGLDLLTRLFCDPGDVVLAEAPSYVGALGTFRSYQAEVVHIAMDEHGLVPSAFREAVIACRAAGKRPKFLYTIPNFNNPSGVTQPLERRKELVAIARELEVLIVEDNPYGLLNLDTDPIPAMRSLDAERVIYLGSFSKTFAPGFRVGWVLAPHAVKDKLVLAQESATLCPPVFSQFAIHQYLSTQDWRGQITTFKDMYRERRDAMMEALEEYMPAGTTWTKPQGGFFVWVTLPPGLDSQAMLPKAVTERVAYTPGTAFFADGLGSRNMRLSFCYPPPDRIREGVRRLAGVIKSDLELHATFGLDKSPMHPEHSLGPIPYLS